MEAGRTRLVLLLLHVLSSATRAQACAQSGYCSLDKVRPWSGCVDSHAALLDALDARGHNKEIVLSVFMSNWVGMIGQQWASMRRLGMGHLLTLGLPGREACEGLMEVLPDMGCAWSEAIHDYWTEIPLYQTLGFNPCTVDVPTCIDEASPAAKQKHHHHHHQQ